MHVVVLDPDDGDKTLIGSLPGISDVIQIGRREYLAVTGGGDPTDTSAASMYRIKNGNVTKIADLGAFEAAVDPAEDGVDSNPFDLAKWRGGKAFVADAAGNSILAVDRNGNVDWVASLPQHPVSTQPLKDAVGCPNAPPDLIDFCSLPPTIDADPVATTVAIGPDGAIYAGELTGFPATPGTSRVWRIEPDARHVKCLEDNDEDDDCTLVETPPFTSIIDINFDDHGTAYVLELDEASWLAAENGQGVGGTVNACRSHGDGDDEDNGVAWSCEEVATGLPFPLAVAIDDESVYVTLNHGFEGPFEVAKLTGTGNGGGDGDDD